MLAEILTSQTRAELFRLLFSGEDKEYYLRQLAREAQVSVRAVQMEVENLQQIHLIVSRRDGNRLYFKANSQNPLYTDIVSIVEKTVGISARLRTVLQDPRIQCACIFGSYASGDEADHSDVDLLIIGDIGMRALSNLTADLQDQIQREINPQIFTEKEFNKQKNQKDHFLTSILNKPMIQLVGDINYY